MSYKTYLEYCIRDPWMRSLLLQRIYGSKKTQRTHKTKIRKPRRTLVRTLQKTMED